MGIVAQRKFRKRILVNLSGLVAFVVPHCPIPETHGSLYGFVTAGTPVVSVDFVDGDNDAFSRIVILCAVGVEVVGVGTAKI